MASYTITRNLTNVSSNTIKLKVAPEPGYALPETIEVLNGTLDLWNPVNGELTISNITDTTTVNIVSVESQIDYFSIKVDYTDNYAGTENEVSNIYIALAAYSGNTASPYASLCDGDLEYSTDKKTWTTLVTAPTDTTESVATGEKQIPVTNGETIYFRGKGNTYIGNKTYGSSYKTFRMLTPETSSVLINKLTVSGDILTLLDYTNPPTSYTTSEAFAELFNEMTSTEGTPQQTGLKYNAVSEIDASNLILPNFTYKGCYGMMFRNNGIVHMPKLPALEVAYQAYRAMFSGTGETKNVTALPATKVSDYAYNSMFNATELDKLPELAATELGNLSYGFMFTRVPRDGISTALDLDGLEPWYLSGSPVILTSTTTTNSMFSYADLIAEVKNDLEAGGPAVLYIDPDIYTIAKLEDL